VKYGYMQSYETKDGSQEMTATMLTICALNVDIKA